MDDTTIVYNDFSFNTECTNCSHALVCAFREDVLKTTTAIKSTKQTKDSAPLVAIITCRFFDNSVITPRGGVQ